MQSLVIFAKTSNEKKKYTIKQKDILLFYKENKNINLGNESNLKELIDLLPKYNPDLLKITKNFVVTKDNSRFNLIIKYKNAQKNGYYFTISSIILCNFDQNTCKLFYLIDKKNGILMNYVYKIQIIKDISSSHQIYMVDRLTGLIYELV